MIEDVLDVSRIVSGKVRLNVQPVEMSTIIREAVETAQPAADARNIRLDVIVDPRGTLVSGDPDRLRQVLWNLCSNAIKFSNKGGRVQVRLERVNSHIEVTVTDNGIGISSEFLPHLFERFSSSRCGHCSPATGAWGLGWRSVAISSSCKVVGSRHTATESAKARHFESSFRCEACTRTLTIGSAITQSHRAILREPQIPELNGIQILVVDDDQDSLALSREILETTGATVITADNGRDALEKLNRNRANVLIADLGMPVDGRFRTHCADTGVDGRCHSRNPRGGVNGVCSVGRPRASHAEWLRRALIEADRPRRVDGHRRVAGAAEAAITDARKAVTTAE